MRITWDKFDALTREQNLLPLEKRTIMGMPVAIAQGERKPDSIMPEDSWIMCYGVSMGEEMIDMVHSIRIPKYVKSKKTGMIFRSQLQDRLALVQEAAENWIKINKEVARY